MAQNQTGRFSLLIAVSMILCTYFIFTATANEVSAESSGKLDILLNSEKEPTDGVYELVYSVENAQNIVSQDVTVNYNDKDFSLENVEMMVDEHYHLWSESDLEPGKHRFILSSVTENYGITGTKPILKLTLKAKNNSADIADVQATALLSNGSSLIKASTSEEENVSSMKATLDVPDQVQAGETVDVVYQVEGAADLVSQKISIEYDEEKLSYVKPEIVVPEHYHIWELIEVEPGEIEVILSSVGVENKIDGEQDILKLTFKTLEAGEADFTLNGMISNGVYTEKLAETSSELQIKLPATPEALVETTEDFIDDDAITKPLSNKLLNTAKQIKHHSNKGRDKQAHSFVIKYEGFLADEENNKYISLNAKQTLAEMINELIQSNEE
ncbi:cohesin domain-containing protein [Virgibacillus halodenitrificans]|uniref:Cohesin domain-containing protein n=1 Tax=Virgibacillus halodenitrificans TaxID=1482 RepID=A0ABR7VHC3_VIRHA|nr:cohesin domain-containing protein [Virgibacillus halodenitrificans]MBD1221341.1 hypothetical protein [Virgibacillus halodenitrificans]